MLDILFYIFAAVTLISGLLMVLSPNAVTGAICMIVCFINTAALFVLLEAFFLAILQILVYAGAVMVIFIFIIMLLDADEDSHSYLRDKMSVAGTIVGFALLVVLIFSAFVSSGALPETALQAVAENPSGEGQGIPFTTSAKSFGYSLFTKYMLPFQVTGFLLLASMIGVIVVSKRQEEAK